MSDSPTLTRGSHCSTSGGVCAMELASQMAGEPWSDSPACVSPLLANFMRRLNDLLPDDTRQHLLPIIPLCLGTAGSASDDQARGLLAVDWIVRTYTPVWLDLAHLTEHAEGLRASPVVDTWERLVDVTPLLITAQEKAAATRAAAWDAARDAARDAAWAAARDAARDAACDDAWSAAWDAAWDATWAAVAARADRKPTIAALQDSAIELAKRMALVGKAES